MAKKTAEKRAHSTWDGPTTATKPKPKKAAEPGDRTPERRREIDRQLTKLTRVLRKYHEGQRAAHDAIKELEAKAARLQGDKFSRVAEFVDSNIEGKDSKEIVKDLLETNFETPEHAEIKENIDKLRLHEKRYQMLIARDSKEKKGLELELKDFENADLCSSVVERMDRLVAFVNESQEIFARLLPEMRSLRGMKDAHKVMSENDVPLWINTWVMSHIGNLRSDDVLEAYLSLINYPHQGNPLHRKNLAGFVHNLQGSAFGPRKGEMKNGIRRL